MGRVREHRLVMSTSACLYGDGSKGPRHPMSWDITRCVGLRKFVWE